MIPYSRLVNQFGELHSTCYSWEMAFKHHPAGFYQGFWVWEGRFRKWRWVWVLHAGIAHKIL